MSMFTSSSSGVPSPSPSPEAAGSSMIRAARQPQPQAFDYFVVLDFEATCEKGARIYPQEIIEFPSVLVDGATGDLDPAEFRTYVRPQYHPALTDFCRDLTGIRQADVDGGVPLAEALRLHAAWLRASAWARSGGCFAVVTWGDWDLRTMLESECRFKDLAKPPCFNHWINLKIPFAAAMGGGRWAALRSAVEAAGLEWEGRAHCGLDDARNTARLLVELMRRGVQLSITTSLRAPSPQVTVTPYGGAAAACYCYCGVAGRGGVVAVPGPMQGRGFYGCGNWTPSMGAHCSYFTWAD
ncbi:hypothetical protein VPH35_023690 [Triticum aestivum]|uniref:ERI1 exoribonuclease 2 n=2 Tax=Triticum TaxID=4564 RepID=UPI000DF51CFA|nr:ERI1 exoribonuclease 2-like [Triticum aestivum]